MTVDDLLTERTVRHWGSNETITPILLSKTYGDGELVIAMVPLNTRPNYYVIRIDSKTDLNSDEWYDQLDGIYNDIEDEYGRHEDCEDDWPALNDNCGVAWDELRRAQ
jgi:hypothetical protein